MTTTKLCPHCNTDQPIDEYYKWRSRDGKIKRQSWCKSCLRQRYVKTGKNALTARSTCDSCIFLTPCRKIVNGKLTRDVVINGVSTRIYLQPYCSPESTMHAEFKKVYQKDNSENMV